MEFFLIIALAIIALSSWLYVLRKDSLFRFDLTKKKEEMDHKMYELAILKELGDRVGYSLDVKQIVDIITGSLHQFIEYSAVSYMLLEPEKVIFRVHLEKSVNRKFVNDIRNRMLGSLSALLDRDFKEDHVEEILSGAIIIDEVEEPVRSFFNIPIVIGGKVEGILTVAHTQAGLYKEDEMTILYKITNQASQAVTRLQEVVEAEQKKLNAMVESMTDGVFMTDLDYRIGVINPAAQKAIGLQDKDDITIFDFIDNLGGKFDIRGRLEESLKLNKTYASERVLLGDRFFQIFVSPVKSISEIGKEAILGGVVIFHDVTTEVELEKIRKDFTSMLVHELRSPLDGIKKISSLLVKKTLDPNSERYDEYIKMVYQNSSNMLDLVTDILDVAKLESENFEVNKEPVDIKDLAEERVSFYDVSAKNSNIKLSLMLSEGIPDNILVDSEGIKHALNNLISNALKFTRESGEVKVIVFPHREGEDLQVEARNAGYSLGEYIPIEKLAGKPALIVLISDNGFGIKESEMKNLFGKFKQLKQNAEVLKKQKGTGLGLVITKGIVEGHGGEIGAVSKEGEGTTFFFTLPLI